MGQITIKYRVAEGEPVQTITVAMEQAQKKVKELQAKGYIIESMGSSDWESF